MVKKLGFVSYDHPGRGNASRRKMSILHEGKLRAKLKET